MQTNNTMNTNTNTMNTATKKNRIALKGNTYPMRKELMELGARWNNDTRAWMVTPEIAEEAQRIVSAAGPKPPRHYKIYVNGDAYYPQTETRLRDAIAFARGQVKCGNGIRIVDENGKQVARVRRGGKWC